MHKWNLVDILLPVELRLLGPVEVAVDGRVLDGGPPQQRAVLAALAVDAGRLVPLPVLVDRVWGQAPPTAARQALYTHIARIRQLLLRAAGAGGGPSLIRRSGGYVLRLDPHQVDVHRFQALVDQAQDVRCPDAERVGLLRSALELWFEEPLAGLAGPWVERMRTRWYRLRLEAVVAWAEAELRLGNGASLVGPLADLAAEHPLAEPLIAALLRALAVAGRAAEALDWYAVTRQRLADELGADPGPELRLLHESLLRGSVETAPALLPPEVYGFVGRGDLLAQLDVALGTDPPNAVVIGVISGSAGVGKTALAVHWAHKVRGRFPDGQLYVNLRGFDPSATATTATEAVRGFLDALGVPPHRLPSSVDGRVGLYRSLLAGRRVLVVLDNARDAEQVRPLLPATPGCLALVISRNQLAGLVTAEGAQPLVVDLLTADEARELLTRRLGRQRVDAEPDAVNEIIERCARLPLALAIVATRAAAHPRFPLAVLADELHELPPDLRAVFSWSYGRLTEGAARMFRLLGLHPGPDAGVPAAASLVGLPADQARRLLAELAEANLLEEHLPSRYTCHDLLRAYATELAEKDADRLPAMRRLLDYYLHSAHAAEALLHPPVDSFVLAEPPAAVWREALTDTASAWSWLDTERHALLALIGHASAGGFDTHVWQLAATLSQFLAKRGHWDAWLATQRAALSATLRLNDLHGQARAHRGLGLAFARLGRLDDAYAHFDQAQHLSRELGDRIGQALNHFNLGLLFDRQERHREALEHAQLAHDHFGAAGHLVGQANADNSIGWTFAKLGDYGQALVYCSRALKLLEEIGDVEGQADTWDSLGFAHHQLSKHAEAATCYERAIGMYRQLGDGVNEADSLVHLGDAQLETGAQEAARESWSRALSILDGLDHPNARETRDRLDRHGWATGPDPSNEVAV